MRQREIKRLNLKFGKFLDPILLLCTVGIIALTVTSVLNLSPETYSQRETQVLGVADNEHDLAIQPIYGEHKYIYEETLRPISSTYFKYTTFVRSNNQERISKPIIHLPEVEDGKQIVAFLRYTNSTTPRIALVESQTSYILKENRTTYTQRIKPDTKNSTIYLLIENKNPVLFDQYIEVDIFLEQT